MAKWQKDKQAAQPKKQSGADNSEGVYLRVIACVHLPRAPSQKANRPCDVHGSVSSIVNTFHSPPMHRRIWYTPCGDVSCVTNTFSSSSRRSAMAATALRNQQLPRNPWLTSDGPEKSIINQMGIKRCMMDSRRGLVGTPIGAGSKAHLKKKGAMLSFVIYGPG